METQFMLIKHIVCICQFSMVIRLTQLNLSIKIYLDNINSVWKFNVYISEMEGGNEWEGGGMDGENRKT